MISWWLTNRSYAWHFRQAKSGTIQMGERRGGTEITSHYSILNSSNTSFTYVLLKTFELGQDRPLPPPLLKLAALPRHRYRSCGSGWENSGAEHDFEQDDIPGFHLQ